MKKYSYELIVIALTIILPIVSAVIETLTQSGSDFEYFLLHLATWTVFWGIGIRLLLAGVNQISRPSFTLHAILGIKSAEASQVVRELGFANFSIGIAGVLTLWIPYWTPAVALIGGLFLGLDGILHLIQKKRSTKENVAMITDLFVALVAVGYAVTLIILQLSIPSYG